METKRKLWSSSSKIWLQGDVGSWNSTCKGPEAEMCSACWRISKEEVAQCRVSQGRFKHRGLSNHCRVVGLGHWKFVTSEKYNLKGDQAEGVISATL